MESKMKDKSWTHLHAIKKWHWKSPWKKFVLAWHCNTEKYRKAREINLSSAAEKERIWGSSRKTHLSPALRIIQNSPKYKNHWQRQGWGWREAGEKHHEQWERDLSCQRHQERTLDLYAAHWLSFQIGIFTSDLPTDKAIEFYNHYYPALKVQKNEEKKRKEKEWERGW